MFCSGKYWGLLQLQIQLYVVTLQRYLTSIKSVAAGACNCVTIAGLE